MSLFPCYDEREDGKQENRPILLGKSYRSAGELIVYSDDDKNEKKKKKKKEKKKRKHREGVRELSDSDFDSEEDHEDYKKLLPAETMLYLPNGSAIQAEQPMHLWKIDKEKDKDFLQMGSFYRLDIPDYDITLLPQSIFHQVTQRTSRPQRPKPVAHPATDSNRYSLRSRYYNDPTTQNSDLCVNRPRFHLERPDKRIKLTSFLIPFPPPLPRDDQILTDDTLGPVMKSDIEVVVCYSFSVMDSLDFSEANFFLTHPSQ